MQCSESSFKLYAIHIPLVAAGLVVGAALAWHVNLIHRRKGELPISSTWIPLLGSAIAFGTDPISLVLEGQKKGKDALGLLLAGSRMFILSDPRSHAALFKADKKQLTFDTFANKVLVNVFGSCPGSLATTDPNYSAEDEFRGQYNKYLMNNQELIPLTQRMQIKLNSMFREIESKEIHVNLKDFIFRFAYRAAVTSLFNSSIADDETLFQEFVEFDKVFAPVLGGVPIGFFPSARRGRNHYREVITTSDRSQFCPMMDARYEIFEREKFHIDDISSFQLAIVWASSGNTMPAAYWTVYYILANPDAKTAVMKELAEAFGDRLSRVDFNIEFDDLSKLQILDSCITEALRLKSGAMVTREVISDAFQMTMASGSTYNFRKGDMISIFTGSLHHDPEIFPDPYTFKYDRFVDSPSCFRKNGVDVPFNMCYMPFGGGTSWCPGRKFAKSEIKTISAYLLARMDMCFSDPESAIAIGGKDYDGGRVGLGIFPPKAGVMLKLSPKKH